MAGIDDLHLSDSIKRIFLAGVGAVAAGAEKGRDVLDKSRGVIDDLVKKGEITVEQGKILNQELKHKADDAKAEAEKKTAAEHTGEAAEDAGNAEEKQPEEKTDLDAILDKLSPEELEALREKLASRGTASEEGEGTAEADK